MLHAQITERSTSFFALLVGEMFDQKHTIKMIDLMLEDPAGEIIEFKIELVPIEIESLHMHLRRSQDLPMEARNRQATLDERGLSPALDNGGIDDDTGGVIVIEDEEALLNTDLRSGQTDAWSVVHGDEHVVHELDERAIDALDLGRSLLENGITDDADDMRSHNPRVASSRVRSIPPLLLAQARGLLEAASG